MYHTPVVLVVKDIERRMGRDAYGVNPKAGTLSGWQGVGFRVSAFFSFRADIGWSIAKKKKLPLHWTKEQLVDLKKAGGMILSGG